LTRSPFFVTVSTMAQPPIRSIAIVGGGTAGWSAAALLSRVLAGSGTAITLIESSDIPTVGVGEATIPPIFEFLQTCGIDEVEFIRATNATFKLAIQFRDWLHQGHRYWHPFGGFGLTIDKRPFHHQWWRYAGSGGEGNFSDFCPAIALAEQHKFAFPPPNGAFPGGALAFALHFDAGLVAGFLRTFSEANGVKRLDRKVVSAEMAGDERIGALVFDDGERLSADV
jgi:tryptophan halogenase